MVDFSHALLPILRRPCGRLLRRQLHALPDEEKENQESAPVTPAGKSAPVTPLEALTDHSLPTRPENLTSNPPNPLPSLPNHPTVKLNGESGSFPQILSQSNWADIKMNEVQ